MLKLFGSILIIGASAALGLAVRQLSVVRVRVLTEWIDCINLLILEIGGQSALLQEAFSVVANSRYQLVAPFFKQLLQSLNRASNFRLLWEKTLTQCAEEWGIKREEYDVLSGLSTYLGQYDGAAQTHNLQLAMLRLTALRDGAAEELQSKKSLYRTCGAAVGILLVLVLT